MQRSFSAALVLALLVAASPATAQEIRGRLKLEPQLPVAAVTYSNCNYYNDDARYRDFSVALGADNTWPRAAIGYGISSRVVLGMSARFWSQDSRELGESVTVSTVDLGPELTVFVAPPQEVRPFLTAGLNGGLEHSDNGEGIAVTRIAGSAGAGIQMRVSERVSVNPAVALTYGHQEGFFYADASCDRLALNALLGLAAWL